MQSYMHKNNLYCGQYASAFCCFKIMRMRYFFSKKYNVLNMLYILLCRGFFRLPSILLHQCRYLKVFSFARAV